MITLPIETTKNMMSNFKNLLKNIFQWFYLNQIKANINSLNI